MTIIIITIKMLNVIQQTILFYLILDKKNLSLDFKVIIVMLLWLLLVKKNIQYYIRITWLQAGSRK